MYSCVLNISISFTLVLIFNICNTFSVNYIVSLLKYKFNAFKKKIKVLSNLTVIHTVSITHNFLYHY